MPSAPRPLIGITANLEVRGERTLYMLRREYVAMVIRAGGAPVILPQEPDSLEDAALRCDGVLISGGDDIDTSLLGIETHPKAEVMPRQRQLGEFALLEALAKEPAQPVLGICLGMQLMGVHGGCRLNQHLDDSIPNAHRHRHDNIHDVHGELGAGAVTSSHHQALVDPGPFTILAVSDDGLIEAINDPARAFYMGVQWHPERTANDELGLGIVRRLVDAARKRTSFNAQKSRP